jgi:GNAT superfamily N-acetyltransferase
MGSHVSASILKSEPTIREATLSDIEALSILCGQLGYPADAAEIAKRFSAIGSSSTDLLLVAELRGSVIGWLQAHEAWVLETGLRAEIVGLVVAPGARRAGAGKALVDAAEKWARRGGSTSVVVRSNANRTESHEFYPALGYAFRKTQKVYAKSLIDPDAT